MRYLTWRSNVIDSKINCFKILLFMDNIIQIEILDKDGHDDLKFCIGGLTGDLTFDTYYFALAVEPYEDISDIKKCVTKFISQWILHIEGMSDQQTSYFPIDISDEYTGCVKISRQGDQLEIDYGYSRETKGYQVDINNPKHYFNSVQDFKTKSSKTILVSKDLFLNSLKNEINTD
jgi:hypothetical protein